MPIYEYRCAACKRRSSLFVRNVASSGKPRCEHCGSAKISRLMSKFAVHGAAPRFDADGAGGMDDIDEQDPRAVARWARQMKDEMGEDLGPEFDDMVGRIEGGEDPESVMAEGDGGFDDGDDF